MRVIGYDNVAITRLKLPGDWPAALNDPSIPARAMSHKLVGVLHDPMVRRSDWKLIFGRRRVAAELHNGASEVWCKLVDCSDEEAQLAADVENAYREHLSSEKQKELTGRLVQQIAKLRAAGEQLHEKPSRRGRLKLDSTIAREVVANVTGQSTESIRKNEQRRKRRRVKLLAEMDVDADIGIRSLGLDLDDKFRADANRVSRETGELAQLLTRAIAKTSALLGTSLPLHRQRLERFRQDCEVLSRLVRGLIPTALCPYCKGVPELQKRCAGCATTGYVTVNQEDQVPKELWGEGAPLVISNGEFVPLDKFYEDAVEDSRNVKPTEAEEEDPFG